MGTGVRPADAIVPNITREARGIRFGPIPDTGEFLLEMHRSFLRGMGLHVQNNTDVDMSDPRVNLCFNVPNQVISAGRVPKSLKTQSSYAEQCKAYDRQLVQGVQLMQQLFDAAAEYFVITVLGGCFVLGMVLKSLTTIVTTASRERSRREIAAYIAEGSINADQGERLIRADVNRGANPAG
jgi:hypothetical protein